MMMTTFVSFRSLRARDIYGMDQWRERVAYKEIRVQAHRSSSKWFFNVLGVKHRNTRGFHWVSDQFTSSWMGNMKCLRNALVRLDIKPRTSGLIVQRFTTTTPLQPLTRFYCSKKKGNKCIILVSSIFSSIPTFQRTSLSG